MLELGGHSVIGSASNGKIAIEIYRTLIEKPDLILMDYRMPLKNGIETTKEILEIDKNSKIIFISADYSVKNEALSLGVIAFLEKPFLYETLINSINNSINNPYISSQHL